MVIKYKRPSSNAYVEVVPSGVRLVRNIYHITDTMRPKILGRMYVEHI